MLLLPEIKLIAWGIIGVGVILLALALIIDFRKVSSALIGRRGRFSAGTTLMASIFLGITLIINGISVSTYKRFDVTQLGQFTLTEQTKAVLKDLNQPVKVICFFVPAKDTYGLTLYATSLLIEYKNYTDFLSTEYVDPDENPERARKYGIYQYQTVVFECGDRYRQVIPTQIIEFDNNGNPASVEAEHAFTSAILEVTGVAQKKVLFLTGHGEQNLGGAYSSVLKGLRDDLDQVYTLDLMTQPVIPEDTAVLVIASPRTPLLDNEIEAINTYIIGGGQVFILADPGFPQIMNDLVTPWGVQLNDGTVIDRASSLASRKDMPRVTADRNFFRSRSGINIVSYFPGAISVSPPEGEETEFYPLVYTSADSWVDKNYDPNKEPAIDMDGEKQGSLSLGVVIAYPALIENKDKIIRMIIIGDSDFAANDHYSQVNNGDLFLNCVNWLAEETQLITLRRTALSFRRLPVNETQSNFIEYSSLALPPILVLLIGGVIWWYRRS
jgi:ABC-type uncharacterized transport system involved in gliding motility auxiliary subunit